MSDRPTSPWAAWRSTVKMFGLADPIPLVRIDAAAGTVGETFSANRRLAAGCLTLADGSVWINSVSFGVVLRLDL